MDLTVVLITGCSSGIGMHLAIRLASDRSQSFKGMGGGKAKGEPPEVSMMMNLGPLPNFSLCHIAGPEGTGTIVGGCQGSRMPSWLPEDTGVGCQRLGICGCCPGMRD